MPVELCKPFQPRSKKEFVKMGNCFDTSERDTIPRYESVDATPLKDSQALMIFVLGGPGVGKTTLCKKLAPK
nr:uncharacterized protein LOC117607250 [Osmia lignaria]